MKTVTKKYQAKNRSRPQSGDFFRSKEGTLVLENGLRFKGRIPAWQSDSFAGEVVFNTGMTGYVESLTDPSYSEQILTFTYPLVGNYGVHAEKWESEKIYARGVVVSEHIKGWSHPQSAESFLSWLK
ncbi:MAG TPA: carbamoyl-phosphate synthase domain-containing protein [Candidatus Saccharimonadales bacterium]|nr:carbamoyl-phosphate synthase domain-containing protein [Candidatus Saccharimonadales bacterium]